MVPTGIDGFEHFLASVVSAKKSFMRLKFSCLTLLSYYYYNWRCWKYRVWHPVVVTPLCPVNTFWRKRFWYVLLVNGMDEVFTLSFFQLMHLPLHASSKRKGLFDWFSSVIKNDLLQLFCRIPVKIGKMFPNSYIFINFVLFSSGKTKFSMASCFL